MNTDLTLADHRLVISVAALCGINLDMRGRLVSLGEC